MSATTLSRRGPLCAAVFSLLAACSSKAPAPDWQMNAQSSVERFTDAYMSGNTLVESSEFKRARDEVARTGKVELVLRVELIRCATRVASLVVEECAGFEKLRRDAGAADRAYADYLAGRLQPKDAALLPEQQRAVAGAGSDAAAAAAVQAIGDPLSKLVAAGAVLRAGRASPALLDTAVDTASAQGWRRPLLAWLGAQALRAEQAGAAAEGQRIRRRMDLVQGTDAAGAAR
ncbi:MAG TPA: hypothetical protein VGP06_19320 [Janthinobacterium sp.]|jgi:hypothetical protein|nr:hypothetical protein [Janthinobacterium sp.]